MKKKNITKKTIESNDGLINETGYHYQGGKNT